MDDKEVDINSLPAQLQSRILGKLNFMNDILSGKIEAPPGMTISAGPSPLDNLLKAVKSDMKSNDNDDDSKAANSDTTFKETSSTLFNTEPPTKTPSKIFTEINMQRLESLNQHATNATKFPLSNAQILSLQNEGYVVIDHFVSDEQLIKSVQKEIDGMHQSGKMKRAGLRKLNNPNESRQNLEISHSGTTEINGLYELCKDVTCCAPIQLLLKAKYALITDVCYHKSNEYAIAHIQTTEKLALFVDSKTCWIAFKFVQSMQFPIIYYVACGDQQDIDGLIDLDMAEWIAIGGVSPFGELNKTNKYLLSSVRSDFHCWLHSDDKDIGKSLKKCIISMDEIRVQLNKLVAFDSNTTQVQATLYPANGAKYETHIDEPPHMKTKSNKRKLTCLMYFNLFDGEVYDSNKHGGSLRIYLGGNKYKDIEPFGGRLVVFNSQWLPHQVLPCYFNRYAVTLWLY